MSEMSEMSVSSMSILVSEQLTRQLVNTAQELAIRCVRECASKYNFDAEEAIRSLGLETVKLERKAPLKEKPEKGPKEAAPKAAFPLPYNGLVDDACCYALRQNNGLYTQCPLFRKKDGEFCKSCTKQMQKVGADVPEYGTIQMRQAVGIMEYVDPKGRKPVHYTKVMKKFKITEEKAREEADKLNIQLNEIHFEITDLDSKRGRPSKAPKVPKDKGVKGRPKKTQKVLQILGDDDDDCDLFAELVAQANEETEDDANKPKKAGKSEEEKEAERLAKEQEKAEKEAKRLQEKAEKEAAKEAERKAKEAEKEAEKAKKEAERKAKEAEKEAEKAKKEAERKAKEEEKAKKEAEKAEKEAKKKEKEEKASKGNKSSKKEEPKEDDEPDVVKKIEFEGKKYLKSKKTGIIYDYTEYVKNSEQVIVGKWNESTNKIDFEEEDKDSDEEESEEEYDM
jgi:hypothetical protein